KSWRFAAVQFFFTGGAARHYLIAHQTKAYRRPRATLPPATFAGMMKPGSLDLRNPRHVRDLERALLKIDPAAFPGPADGGWRRGKILGGGIGPGGPGLVPRGRSHSHAPSRPSPRTSARHSPAHSPPPPSRIITIDPTSFKGISIDLCFVVDTSSVS